MLSIGHVVPAKKKIEIDIPAAISIRKSKFSSFPLKNPEKKSAQKKVYFLYKAPSGM
jgi:hypothetical protein